MQSSRLRLRGCRLFKLLRKMSTNTTNGHNVVEEPFSAIRDYLSSFRGGKISLNKNSENGIATLVLDNPEKKNAINGCMMVDFRDCIEELEKWKEGKGVILCGKGGNFCSGGDLDFARASGNPQGAWRMSTWMQDSLKRLKNLPLISVCLIEGPSLGGGAEISTFCDFIIAADNVKYGFVHGRLGIITAWAGASSLVSRVGKQKALDLLLTARILEAQECLDLGLVEAIVPASEALSKTEEWLMSRTHHHHAVIHAFKDIVSRCDGPVDDVRLYEKERFLPLWGGELNRQALARRIKHVKK